MSTESKYSQSLCYILPLNNITVQSSSNHYFRVLGSVVRTVPIHLFNQFTLSSYFVPGAPILKMG